MTMDVGNPTQAGVPAGTFEERKGVTPPVAPPATPPATPPAPPEATVAPIVVGEKPAAPDVTPNPSTTVAYSYEPTGDAGLDYALAFVGNLGYGDSHPAILAAQQGDFSLIKVELATKGVQGAEAVVALAEAAYGKSAAKAQAAAQELNTFAHTAAGGADNWAAINAWASANADPEEKADLNEALAKGGVAAKRAIKYIVDGYRAQHTLPKEPAAVAKPGAATSASASKGPMSAKEYADAVNALYVANRGREIEHLPEYHALTQQRLQAQRSGY